MSKFEVKLNKWNKIYKENIYLWNNIIQQEQHSKCRGMKWW